MRHFLVLSVVALLASGCTTPSKAGPKEYVWTEPAPKEGADLEFNSLRDLAEAGSVLLAGGETIEDPDLWTAVVVAERGAGRYCTAALIGPNVLLTAAHCVDAYDETQPSRTVGGTVKVRGIIRPLQQCTMSTPYADAPIPVTDNPRSSEDFALCEVGGAIQDVTFETLGQPGTAIGTPLLLSGFGCTKIFVFANKLSSNPGDKTLRIGDSQVEAVGKLDSSTSKGAYLRARAEDYETILCPGDSGGPAFAGASLAHQEGPRRRVVGVNSKVLAIEDGGSYDYLSFFSATSSKAFANLLKDWQALSPAKRGVCGRDVAAGEDGCRP